MCFEMIKYGSEKLHTMYLKIINALISSSSTDDNWRDTLFTMIPKAGDVTQAINYTPNHDFVNVTQNLCSYDFFSINTIARLPSKQ